MKNTLTSTEFLTKLLHKTLDPNVHYTVFGTVNLMGLDVKTLPDNLTIADALILESSAIYRLPENLTVKSLFAANTNLQQLPSTLVVTNHLDLYNTKIEDLSNVNISLSGGLNLPDCITRLPDVMRVGKLKGIACTYLYDLPCSITADEIDFRWSGLKNISGTVKAKLLDLDHTPLSRNHSKAEIQAMILNSGGSVDELFC